MSGASVRITSHVDKIKKKLESAMRKKMRLIGETVASQVRENISESTRANGPSEPGEFPHADTGNLRKSIDYDVDDAGGGDISVRIGTPVEYGKFLEEGTGKMEARPFLERTARELENEIEAIIRAPIK